ncbi:transposase [Flexivirga caeni]|uniref:Transposase n=2 Tax=Flexivirga caeni TaxID=2294115 RepID=A0A3M9LWC9_9MICO|nr:transposase [Flexivirga caeni]
MPGRVVQQPSFADVEYGNRRRRTRRDEFLAMMDQVIPWDEWTGLIVPFYPTTGRRGRQPVPVETMLRMYLLQAWFSLSDEGTEDAIYDSYAFRTFLGLDFTTAQVPDATTLLHFRHLIEQHDLGAAFLDAQTRAGLTTAPGQKSLALDSSAKFVAREDRGVHRTGLLRGRGTQGSSDRRNGADLTTAQCQRIGLPFLHVVNHLGRVLTEFARTDRLHHIMISRPDLL